MAETESKTGTAPVVVNVNHPAEKNSEPEQLRAAREAKLEQARNEGVDELLTDLGVKKSERARLIEEIKAGRVKLAEARDEIVAAKEAETKAKAEADAFKPFKDQVESLQSTLKKYADQEFSSLPEPFQKALAAMKLDDPKARLDMIEVWKSTGVISAAQAKEAVQEVKDEATAAKPSTTMAAAPSVSSPAGPVLNHYEHWKQLQTQGHTFLAAQYWNAHQRKILEQRPKQ